VEWDEKERDDPEVLFSSNGAAALQKTPNFLGDSQQIVTAA
jgi:hypothetical protein